MLNNGLGLLRSESLKLQITDPRHIGGDAEKRNSLETGNPQCRSCCNARYILLWIFESSFR